MARTVIHLPAQITARSEENKNRIYGWSRQRLKHMLSKNNAFPNEISQLNHFQNKGLFATLMTNRDYHEEAPAANGNGYNYFFFL